MPVHFPSLIGFDVNADERRAERAYQKKLDAKEKLRMTLVEPPQPYIFTARDKDGNILTQYDSRPVIEPPQPIPDIEIEPIAELTPALALSPELIDLYDVQQRALTVQANAFRKALGLPRLLTEKEAAKKFGRR